VCPECSGSVAPSLTVCADHDAGGGFCEHCDGRYGVWLRGICENCKLSLNFPAWLRVLMDPRVGAFCLDHGVDVTAGLNWENWAALHEIRETVHATDPLDATVAFELDGETLTTRLGADFDVREVRRNS
jgi:hypothetical protein